MDLGVYCGEKRIGEMERVTEGLYTRLSACIPAPSCHCEPPQAAWQSVIPEEKRIPTVTSFPRNDTVHPPVIAKAAEPPVAIRAPCHCEERSDAAIRPPRPLYRLWLSDTPLGLMEERGNSLRFSRRYSKAELKKLPAEGRFQILPDGEKPTPPEKVEEAPPGPRILRVHVNGKKYTVIRY